MFIVNRVQLTPISFLFAAAKIHIHALKNEVDKSPPWDFLKNNNNTLLPHVLKYKGGAFL